MSRELAAANINLSIALLPKLHRPSRIELLKKSVREKRKAFKGKRGAKRRQESCRRKSAP